VSKQSSGWHSHCGYNLQAFFQGSNYLANDWSKQPGAVGRPFRWSKKRRFAAKGGFGTSIAEFAGGLSGGCRNCCLNYRSFDPIGNGLFMDWSTQVRPEIILG